MNAIERLIYATTDREKKVGILSLWMQQAKSNVTLLEKQLEHEKSLLELLAGAKHKIEIEIYDDIFVDPQPKIDWTALCLMVKEYVD